MGNLDWLLLLESIHLFLRAHQKHYNDIGQTQNKSSPQFPTPCPWNPHFLSTILRLNTEDTENKYMQKTYSTVCFQLVDDVHRASCSVLYTVEPLVWQETTVTGQLLLNTNAAWFIMFHSNIKLIIASARVYNRYRLWILDVLLLSLFSPTLCLWVNTHTSPHHPFTHIQYCTRAFQKHLWRWTGFSTCFQFTFCSHYFSHKVTTPPPQSLCRGKWSVECMTETLQLLGQACFQVSEIVD